MKRYRWTGRMMIIAMMMVMIFSVNVFAAKPVLNKTKLTLNVGQSYNLKLKNYKNTVRWSSSDYVKASISATGKVVARKKGTVTLTAKAGKKSYRCKLTVNQPVTRIQPQKLCYEVKKGETFSIKTTVFPSNANNKKLTWQSNNKKVATVSSAGKVKAVGNGAALITITAKDGSRRKAYCRIVVKGSTEQSDNETDASAQNKPSASALKFLNALQKMSDRVKSDRAQGRIWAYGKTHFPGSWTQECEYVAQGNIGRTVCSGIARWGLTEAGIINSKQHLYAKEDGTFYFNSRLKNDASFRQKFEVITVNKTPNQLLKEGNLLPGDICGWKRVMHTNIYAGDGKWYDAGRGVNTITKNGEYYFQSFGPSSGWMNDTIVQILRLK